MFKNFNLDFQLRKKEILNECIISLIINLLKSLKIKKIKQLGYFNFNFIKRIIDFTSENQLFYDLKLSYLNNNNQIFHNNINLNLFLDNNVFEFSVLEDEFYFVFEKDFFSEYLFKNKFIPNYLIINKNIILDDYLDNFYYKYDLGYFYLLSSNKNNFFIEKIKIFENLFTYLEELNKDYLKELYFPESSVSKNNIYPDYSNIKLENIDTQTNKEIKYLISLQGSKNDEFYSYLQKITTKTIFDKEYISQDTFRTISNALSILKD